MFDALRTKMTKKRTNENKMKRRFLVQSRHKKRSSESKMHDNQQEMFFFILSQFPFIGVQV